MTVLNVPRALRMAQYLHTAEACTKPVVCNHSQRAQPRPMAARQNVAVQTYLGSTWKLVAQVCQIFLSSPLGMGVQFGGLNPRGIVHEFLEVQHYEGHLHTYICPHHNAGRFKYRSMDGVALATMQRPGKPWLDAGSRHYSPRLICAQSPHIFRKACIEYKQRIEIKLNQTIKRQGHETLNLSGKP